MKLSNNLYKAKNVDEVRLKLNEYNIDIDQIIKDSLNEGVEYGTFICGSLTDGNATYASDLDIMILLDDENQIKDEKTSINLMVENTKETLHYVNGIEINITFKTWKSMHSTINDFISIAPALYNPHDIESFPVIGKNKLQFLHNLKNAWILSGDNIVNRWKDECMVDILPIYLSVHHFLISLELFEDAKSVVGTAKGGAMFISKMCIEHLMLSILSKEGFTNQNRKWIFHNAEKIESLDVKKIFDDLFITFFEPYKNLDHDSEFVNRTSDLLDQTKEILKEDQSIGKAIEYILEEINYVE